MKSEKKVIRNKLSKKSKKKISTGSAKRSKTEPSVNFPIVGIGASAGGLEAAIQLFSKMPANTGMGFVLVQHLDPNHPSLSAEIIARSTELQVEEATDDVQVKPGHIYIIPPNHNLEILSGVLKLTARDQERGQNMAIDIFFQALARSQKQKAIGIVLSGTGTDGTMGLQAIKSEGGVTFVQEPASAKYSGMPQTAIDAGVADFVLRPEKITKELSRVASRTNVSTANDTQTIETSDNRSNQLITEILKLLRAHTKIDFADYKTTTIMRRIQHRMMVQKTKRLQDYLNLLHSHDEEIKALFNDILINVTAFYRDPESFAVLENVFKSMVKNKTANSPIRIWVPGCATGEEVYSIAISLIEFLKKSGKQYPIQIFATDVSEPAILKARNGIYSESSVQNIPKDELDRYFIKVEGGYRIQKSIRNLCLFSRHDVTSDPPFSRIDFISCRNVLIYFGKELQKRIFPIFHYALLPGGYLWLGRAENVGEFSKLFDLVEKSHKVFKKSNIQTPAIRFSASRFQEFPEKAAGPFMTKPVTDIQRDAEKILLSKFSPPSVIINSEFEILQFRGRTVPFLEPASGQPSLNLLKMAQPELAANLRSIVQQAKKANVPVERSGLHFENNEKTVIVDVEVIPVDPKAKPAERTFLVLFKQAESKTKALKQPKTTKKIKGSEKRILELMKELTETKEYQQALIEQYEAAQEELTSANEELQSTNEEFQSTNEEIQTAQEELQSTNEELITVNEELQMRNADLTTLSSDLNNLLASIEVPVLIVDGDHKVRRFSPKARSAFRLIPSDIGRPISDIKPSFNLNLDELVSEVSETLSLKEVEVEDIGGRWLRIQVRPYKTVDNKIDGAIFVITDIDTLKKRQNVIQEARIEADKSNFAKDIFLATLSHELRNPLSAILSWGQLIAEGRIDATSTKKGAEVIVQSAKTQSRLIDDLLDVSRIIAGKLAIEIKTIEPTSYIFAAVDAVRFKADKKSIQIHCDFPAQKALIQADPIRLQQIIWNLLTNAIKFSPKKSVVNVDIKLVEAEDKHFVRIMVSDQGKGIPPEFLPHIFQRFSQADSTSTRVHGGLGLGLSIVHSLVEMQNGTVVAENATSGTGAVFTVTFPIALQQSAISQTGLNELKDISNTGIDVKSLAPSLEGLRILIAEDDEGSRVAIGLSLKSLGADILTVESASEVLSSLSTFKPDVLVSDIAMPGETGYSLINRIRSLGKTEGGLIPALALSAYTTPEDVKEALAAGFQAHVAKPVDANDLAREILKLIAEKNER